MANPIAVLIKVAEVIELGGRILVAAAGAMRRRTVPPPSPRTQAWLTRHYWTREAPSEPPPRCIWCGELKSTAGPTCPGAGPAR